MNNFLNKLLANLKHIPTTIAGAGAFLATLPSIPAVQQLMGLNPAIGTRITAIAAIGSALVLIFGVGGATKA